MNATQKVSGKFALRCSDCGAMAEAACNCGVGYIPAGEYAKKLAAEHPEMSNRAVAEKGGVSEPTIRRARAGASFDAPDQQKRTGRDGKLYSTTQSPRKPRINKVEAIAETLKSQTGQWPDSNTLARTANVSSRAADNALRTVKAVEQGREETAIVTPMFTKAQDHHVEARVKVRLRELEQEFDARVQRETKANIDKLFPKLEQLREEAKITKELYMDRLEKRAIFKLSEYMDIVKCCHPDNSASMEVRQRAFILVSGNKLQLTGRE